MAELADALDLGSSKVSCESSSLSVRRILANYYYSIAIEIIPDYTLALTNLGYSYEKLNLSVESYNCYKNALVWDPENRLASSRILVVEKKLRYLVVPR